MTERAAEYEGGGLDGRVRRAAFAFLADETARRGHVLPRAVLAQGFLFEGQRVRLIGPQGIFKPAILSDLPLTITTAPRVSGRPRPYEDEIGDDGLIKYRYRGIDPQHHENVGLRLAMRRRVPLIYLHGIVNGEYAPAWPAFIVSDDQPALIVPRAAEDRPASDLLAERYEMFKKAS